MTASIGLIQLGMRARDGASTLERWEKARLKEVGVGMSCATMEVALLLVCVFCTFVLTEGAPIRAIFPQQRVSSCKGVNCVSTQYPWKKILCLTSLFVV